MPFSKRCRLPISAASENDEKAPALLQRCGTCNGSVSGEKKAVMYLRSRGPNLFFDPVQSGRGGGTRRVRFRKAFGQAARFVGGVLGSIKVTQYTVRFCKP